MPIRKSSRKTAGQLPSRYLSKKISSSPPFAQQLGSRNISSSATSSSSQANELSSTTPISREDRTKSIIPMSPRALRSPQTKRGRTSRAREEAERKPIKYPSAAFPTLDHRAPEGTDVNRREKAPWNSQVGAFRDGTNYCDQDGQRLHFISEWCESNFDDGRHDHDKDKKRDEHQRAPVRLGVSMTGLSFNDDTSAQTAESSKLRDITNEDFLDKEFAAIHYRLQVCIINEIEEDLRRRPPANEKRDIAASPVRHQYLCTILGIHEASTIRAIRSRVERTRSKYDEPDRMPTGVEFSEAKKWLTTKGLPITLLELFYYLDGEM